MKTIGLLGGMSWESTIPYYRLINEGIKQRLGGLHSAQVLLHSVDFHEIEDFLFKWEYALRKENEDGLSAESYIEELDNLVINLLNR